jgi:6-phosphogluconolactonase
MRRSNFSLARLSIAVLVLSVVNGWTSVNLRAADGAAWVFIGTYTGGKSQGIYRAKLDLASGTLSGLELAAKIKDPSFLAIHPSGKFLYAVGEVGMFAGKTGGALSAFAVDATSGKLTLLNQQSSRGAGPCHLNVDREGKNLLVANYGGGSVAVLPIDADGKLREASEFVQHVGKSVNPRRQESPHAHSINLDPVGRFAFVADLGLDKVLIYKFDSAAGKLTPNDPPHASVAPGAGPRHFAFHPGGQFAYVCNEIHSTVTAFRYDTQAGKLTELHTTTTLPGEHKGNSTAEILVHPSGKFLYVSNRGHDSLAIFRIDNATGSLTAVGHQPTGGKTPRNFAIDPTGQWVLAENQSSDSIVAFKVDPESGKLSPTGQKLEVPSPVCVRFLMAR